MERQLRRWVKAGLVTREQAQQIRAFESEQRRPLFAYGVAGLGALAIAIGLVSIVAANWDAIPGRVKVGIDLVLVVAAGFAVVRFEQRGPSWLSEAALVVAYGLVLASIALVGQVYQLGGSVPEALAMWSALTAVLMSRARSTFAAVLWVAGLQISFAAGVVEIADTVDRWETFYVSTLYWVPLVGLLVSRWLHQRPRRGPLARVLAVVGWIELLMCATIGTFVFYEDTRTESWGPMLVGAAMSAVLTMWVVRNLPAGEARRPTIVLLVACWALSHIPWPISPGGLDLLGALAFIGLWLGAAFTAYRGRWAHALNAATAIVGIRIIAVYFEVFGSLLDTGLGLVVGGGLTLGLVWFWARKRKEFQTELTEAGEP